MHTRLIGDIHGTVYDYQMYSIKDFKGPTIQVGDFGIGFSGPYWHEQVSNWQTQNPQHRFIRGNHDNPVMCKTMPGYIPDGHVENNVMFVGGAWSIDNPEAPPGWYRRTKDIDWWEDEECSDTQFDLFLDIYRTVKPSVMITHDCPHIASHELFFRTGLVKGTEYQTRTATALQKMWEVHKPDFWFFGHWHHTVHAKINGTHFQCIGELDYIDFDLNTMEFAV